MGATYKGKKLGTQSDIGIFSFDFGKTITTGEGGCLLTNNKKKYLYFKRYHDHGHKLIRNLPRGVDDADMPGFNYRMTELQAAVGLAQLPKLKYILRESKKRFSVIENKLKNKVKLRGIYKGSIPNYDTLIFKIDDKKKRSKIVKYLNSTGVGTKNLPDAIKWHFAFLHISSSSRPEISVNGSHKK